MYNANGDCMIREHQLYKVGIYARLSREDEVKDGAKKKAKLNTDTKSESIKNQLNYLNAYAYAQDGWSVVDEYCDDGYSGGNYDRPSFTRLLEDIDEGKINLVLVKDLSRLGRDMGDTMNYKDKYFPERDVRFIALSDGIDTFADSLSNDMAGGRAWFNDLYLRDSSKKIKTALYTKKNQGLYTAPYAPYGYVKDKNDKNRLVIDDTAAEVVRRIYSLYTSGTPMLRIATILNQEEVPPPSEYKRQTIDGYNIKGWNKLWEQHAIRDILSSQMYIGNMVQGKSARLSYKSKKLKRKPKDKWIIIEGTHEPIIDRDTFDTAQYLLSKNQTKGISKDGAEHLLDGLLYCGECGEKVYITYSKNQEGKLYHTVCSKWRRFGKHHCTPHRIHEEILNKHVVGELRHISEKIIDSETLASKLNDTVPKHEARYCEKELDRIDRRITDMNKQLVESYKDKSKGILSEDDFLIIRDTINSQREELINKRGEVAAKLQIKKDNLNDHVKAIRQLLTLETPNKVIISQLVERITIYQRENGDKEIVIQHTFPNPLED